MKKAEKEAMVKALHGVKNAFGTWEALSNAIDGALKQENKSRARAQMWVNSATGVPLLEALAIEHLSKGKIRAEVLHPAFAPLRKLQG